VTVLNVFLVAVFRET